MKKQLLTDHKLAESAVVANNRMNRKRKATGINSYEKDIWLNPIQFLESRVEQAPLHWFRFMLWRGKCTH